MSIFTSITSDAEYVACCPRCEQWLWKVGPNSAFFGKASIEKPVRYLATDGDTIQFGKALPAPLTAYTEYDAKLLKGECPHCGAGYWFVTVAYPAIPVSNVPHADSPAAFLCDESYIDIADQVHGTFIGDRAVAENWVLMRQSAGWQNAQIRVDVHMIGPFADGEALVGPNGVSGCGPHSRDDTSRAIWTQAADLVRAITPHAVEYLRKV